MVAATDQLGEQRPVDFPPYPTPVMNLNGESGVSGMLFQGKPGAFYGSLNFVPEFANSQSWINATGSWDNMLQKQENTYATMHDRAISRTNSSQALQLSGSTVTDLNTAVAHAVTGGDFMTFNYDLNHNPAKDFKVAIIEIKNSGGGDITIGPLNMGTNKAVLLIDQGTVNITGNITLDESNPANAGFLAILSQGNINIGGSAASGPTPAAFPNQNNIADPSWPADITAIMYTDSNFTVNNSVSQLKVNGTITAKGSVNLGRTSKGPYPSEFVHYNPRMIRILRDVGLRRKIVYQEGN
jgi:hypothetical protein